MRYLGNKQKILIEIENLIICKGLDNKNYTFFDAFSGTGTVGGYFKDRFRIISNDNLYMSFVMASAKTNTPDLKFELLEFDPFEYFNSNSNSKTKNGFIYNNYSPGGSERQYFSAENAGKIDYIRNKIDDWFKLDKLTYNERLYLIACLIESASKVANIAGVYGAYLKIWDPRAVKPMKFIKVEQEEKTAKFENEVRNDNIEDIISDIHGDILYLDPPYTSTQYASQYHVLETIARNDTPNISGKTGQREKSNQISAWCKKGEVEVVFEKIIAKSNFNHIIFSYSPDGIMSKDYIEKVLKRYGKPETYKLTEIPYTKYQNHNTRKNQKHAEYLFYIEKEKPSRITYASPLNYIGGKYDMINFLKGNMPSKIDSFIDLFGGGCNVSVNLEAEQIIYNDCNTKVVELIEYFRGTPTDEIIKYMNKMIKKFKLSNGNKEAYVKLREYYNSFEVKKRPAKILFLLVCFSFQHQFRFNSSLEYNNPVGTSGFNECILEKLVSFCREIKEKNIVFESKTFEKIEKYIDSNSFIYCDPPYLVTLGSYNDGKRGFNGWTEKDEEELLRFLDKQNKKGVKFMLSNVFEHKGIKNNLLVNWVKKNADYNVIQYPHKARNGRQEVIITNYVKEQK